MADLLIKEGAFLHNILLQGLSTNIDKILQLKSFSEVIHQITLQFSTSIINASRKFQKKIRGSQQKIDQSVSLLNKCLLQTMSQLNRKVTKIAQKIQNQIVEPLEQFISNHIETNKRTLHKSQAILSEIQVNSSYLKEIKKNFKSNNQIGYSQQQKAQLKQIHDEEIQKCNWKWLEVKKQYKQILIEADTYHESRRVFSKKLQSKLIRLINRLLNSSTIEEKINEIEYSESQNQAFSLYIKDQIRQTMGKSGLLEENSLQQLLQNGSVSLEEQDKINCFVQIFTNRSNVKQASENFEMARNLIIDSSKWAEYFLQKLQSNLHTEMRLTTSKFHELTTIMKYIFATAVELKNNQSLIYCILFVSYRITNNEHYIIQEIGKYQDYWNDHQVWYNLIEYILMLREKKIIKIPFQKHGQKLVQLWKHGRDRWLKIAEKYNKNQKTNSLNNSDMKYYEILCEINYYLARLQLKQKFIFNFLATVGKKFKISKEHIEKLLKFHYFNKRNNKNTLDNHSIRKKRLQQKYRTLDRASEQSLICVIKSLKYLKIGPDILKLRLVCKKWSKELENKIYKRYLIQQKDYETLSKIRLKIYLNIAKSPYSAKVYERMTKQLPNFTQHKQLIQLDVKRSLSWDQSLRGTLTQILIMFSFYNPELGYLQGMNYLCENILKLTDDEFNVYRIFEYLMNNQFSEMYGINFEGLKIRIYQFMRILQKQLPKLYNHFQAEKLQGEHFLMPWAITLWGQTAGDLSWVLWDGFFVKGWKWWFKTCIWILKMLQLELLSMNFQQIMKCFSELNSTLLASTFGGLSDFGINVVKLKEEINSIRIQNETLKDLQKQYKLKVSMLKQYIKKIGT